MLHRTYVVAWKKIYRVIKSIWPLVFIFFVMKKSTKRNKTPGNLLPRSANFGIQTHFPATFVDFLEKNLKLLTLQKPWYTLLGFTGIKRTLWNLGKNSDFFVASNWVHEIGSNFAYRLPWSAASIGEVWAHFVYASAHHEKNQNFQILRSVHINVGPPVYVNRREKIYILRWYPYFCTICS